ncbi:MULTISPECIES: hypothetical protein [Pseudomonas]|uniref:Uncharacterized protein n=1 Tax=Pseudomonas farsensis TaxID=2745492 RepID=A0ABU8QWM3_9PSED|nr:hypothetical protein [Pseudomonas sp. SWRI51]MBC3410698.1 hypothetical protein [Pseudomonas sp. SWRI51]
MLEIEQKRLFIGQTVNSIAYVESFPAVQRTGDASQAYSSMVAAQIYWRLHANHHHEWWCYLAYNWPKRRLASY